MTRLLTALIALASLSACASMEPEPCTSEWVEWKSERILTGFARANYSEVRRLKAFSDTLSEGEIGPIAALRIPGMIDDFKSLAKSFEKRVLPELNAAVSRCGSAQELVPAFTTFLRKEGVGEDVIEWVEFLTPLMVE